MLQLLRLLLYTLGLLHRRGRQRLVPPPQPKVATIFLFLSVIMTSFLVAGVTPPVGSLEVVTTGGESSAGGVTTTAGTTATTKGCCYFFFILLVIITPSSMYCSWCYFYFCLHRTRWHCTTGGVNCGWWDDGNRWQYRRNISSVAGG